MMRLRGYGFIAVRSIARRLAIPFAIFAIVGFTAGSAAATSDPKFVGLSGAQQRRFLARVEATPKPLRVLIESSFRRLKVRNYHGKLGGGNYTATIIDSEGTRFTVALAPRSLSGGAYGLHMTLHELGHVVINAFLRRREYEGMFELFAGSPLWQDCFPSQRGDPEPCVSPDEILAEQIAFLGSGQSFRSAYDVPPLAGRRAMLSYLRPVAQRVTDG